MSSLFPWGLWHYLIGGLLIGVAVSLAFLMTGKVTGMSTVFSSTWSWFSRLAWFQQPDFVTSRTWRLVLAVGLMAGGGLWWWVLGPAEANPTRVPVWQLALGGFLVGYGARRSRGCTAGHGICGIASGQAPSMLATAIFVACGMLSAHAWRALGGL